MAYKPDIDDMRESPALDFIHLLKPKETDIHYHDPFLGFNISTKALFDEE